MAASCLRSTLLFKRLIFNENVCHLSSCLSNPIATNPRLLCPAVVGQLVSVRYGSFFNKKSADDLWKSNTTVSNQGRRRGRASRGKIMRRDNFSKGNFGQGKSGLQFPGLSEIIQFRKRDMPKLHYDKNKVLPDAEIKRAVKRGKFTIHPLDRGYTGRSLAGRKLGPPDSSEGYDFNGFESIILKTGSVGTVTASQGSVTYPYCVVAVGNGNGLIGVAASKGSTIKAAMKTAKKKASKRLLYVKRFEDHTIHHNFSEQYLRSKLIVYGKEEGYGLVCHNVIKTLCQLIGIKNIYAKAEGNTKNYLALSRAFINGLLRQKTFQQMADETGHHVVEYRIENNNYPVVVASPSPDSHSDFEKGQFFNFETYCFDGKTRYVKEKRVYYEKFKGHKKKALMDYKRRNQKASKMQRMALNLEKEYLR